MDFLRLFLRRHLAEKPVVASRNVDGFICLSSPRYHHRHLSWPNLFVGRGKATAAIDAARARTSLLATIRREEDSLAAQRGDYIPRPLSPVEKANTEASEKQQKIVKDGIYTTPTPTPSEDATWLEKAVSEV